MRVSRNQEHPGTQSPLKKFTRARRKSLCLWPSYQTFRYISRSTQDHCPVYMHGDEPGAVHCTRHWLWSLHIKKLGQKATQGGPSAATLPCRCAQPLPLHPQLVHGHCLLVCSIFSPIFVARLVTQFLCVWFVLYWVFSQFLLLFDWPINFSPKYALC